MQPMTGLPNQSVATREIGARLPRHLVLYDGVCRVCDSSVNWLVEHDRAARLHFAPLQGSTTVELRQRHPEIPNDVDTIVYVEVADGTERVYLRSAAILRICEVIGVDSWALRWLRRLPHWCTDLGYRMFVRVRYRAFGKLEVCRMPEPGEAERFLP